MNHNKLLSIANKIKSEVYFDYNIGKITWFRTGGNAKNFIIAENSYELEIIINEIKNDNYYIIGSGSNLLVRDKGYKGTIIKLGPGFRSLNFVDDKIEVGAGTQDINLSNFAYKNNIKGFEFFSGIPGSIGGAIKMNAGCFGSETKELLHSIEIYNNNNERKIIKKHNLNLIYRSSNIPSRHVISKAYFNFEFGEKLTIKEKMQNIKKQRLYSQPIQNKTSGSTFKNPKNLFAAKLIEEAGCKGLKYGNAFVSEKHSNFLINNGNATASDLENLGKIIIDRVYSKFNIMLEWEIKIIGDQ